VACVLVVVLAWAGVQADPALTWVDVAALPTTLYVHFVLVFVVLGVAGDVRPALARADARLSADGLDRVWPSRLRATFEELWPGVAAQRERDAETERRRLAGDLHADVLPLLRRAIAEAETGAGPEALATRLRAVDLELERLLAARWPVILDTFGLIEALEDLAERTEAGGPTVEIDVVAADGRPPGEVERAAYRIGQIALDNAVRHGGPSHVRIAVRATSRSLRLEVGDDGRGLDAAAVDRASRDGRHGLADAAEQARRVGGRLSIDRLEPSGTTVAFTWEADGGGSSVRPDRQPPD
jgi:signal transduction histidine kinase